MSRTAWNALAALATMGLAACGGGGGGDDGGGGGGTPPAGTITSFRSIITPLASVDATELAVGSFGGTLPGGAPALRVADDSPFLFSTAYFQGSNTADSLVLQWSEPLEDGREHAIRARFLDWENLSSLASGLRLGYTDVANLRGFRASEYDRPEGAQLVGVFLDGSGTVALSYTSFGYWSFFDTFTDGSDQFIASGGVSIGEVSPDLNTIASLPATATYTGVTVGSAVATDANFSLALAGKISLTANFETDRLSATISDIKFYDGETVHTTEPGDTIGFSGATITPADASFYGDTGSGMTVKMGTETLDGSGALAGHFYGPNAEEVGGTWGIVEVDPEIGTIHTSGSFGAKR